MGHGKRGVFCSRVLAERVGHAFWLVCAGLPARGAARSFGPGGRRCPESGDARRANGAGTRTTEMPAVVRSGAGLTNYIAFFEVFQFQCGQNFARNCTCTM